MDPRLPLLGLAGVDVALAAVSWLILLCTYPDFARWRPEDFAHHHEGYTRRVGWVVGPLLLGQLAGHLGLVLQGEGLLAGAAVAAGWLITALWSVPCHRRLQCEGPASPALASLCRSHAWRTALWTLLAMDSMRRAAG
jgi:hypothetical protein